jgi:hypothetical protein
MIKPLMKVIRRKCNIECYIEAKSWVSFDWLARSSELQPCLKLWRFIQALLKTKSCKMESEFPHRNLQKDPCVTFIRTDGVLLEVHNRKEGHCA